jgi:hypothetical protein
MLTMEMNWQTVVVAMVVGIAIWHLVRRGLAVLHAPGRNSCGGSSSCADPDEKQVKPVELYRVVELHDLGEAPSRADRSDR